MAKSTRLYILIVDKLLEQYDGNVLGYALLHPSYASLSQQIQLTICVADIFG
jgi:hypothetical protein